MMVSATAADDRRRGPPAADDDDDDDDDGDDDDDISVPLACMLRMDTRAPLPAKPRSVFDRRMDDLLEPPPLLLREAGEARDAAQVASTATSAVLASVPNTYPSFLAAELAPPPITPNELRRTGHAKRMRGASSSCDR